MQSVGFHDLVRQAQGGDRGAMDQVLAILRPHLERLARPYADPARPAASTSDLLQESCLRAWEKIGAFEGGQHDEETFAKFQAWIGRIVRNLGLNLRRDQDAEKRNPPGDLVHLDRPGPAVSTTGAAADPPARGAGPSTLAHAGDLAEKVRASLDEMSDQTSAAVVRMHYFEEMTFPEIAAKLGLRYDQVRERYRATMRRLEQALKAWQ